MVAKLVDLMEPKWERRWDDSKADLKGLMMAAMSVKMKVLWWGFSLVCQLVEKMAASTVVLLAVLSERVLVANLEDQLAVMLVGV
jgi:hypothetical protein